MSCTIYLNTFLSSFSCYERARRQVLTYGTQAVNDPQDRPPTDTTRPNANQRNNDDELWNLAWDYLIGTIVTSEMALDQRTYLSSVDCTHLHDKFEMDPRKFKAFLGENCVMLSWINSTMSQQLTMNDVEM